MLLSETHRLLPPVPDTLVQMVDSHSAPWIPAPLPDVIWTLHGCHEALPTHTGLRPTALWLGLALQAGTEVQMRGLCACGVYAASDVPPGNRAFPHIRGGPCTSLKTSCSSTAGLFTSIQTPDLQGQQLHMEMYTHPIMTGNVHLAEARNKRQEADLAPSIESCHPGYTRACDTGKTQLQP